MVSLFYALQKTVLQPGAAGVFCILSDIHKRHALRYAPTSFFRWPFSDASREKFRL